MPSSRLPLLFQKNAAVVDTLVEHILAECLDQMASEFGDLAYSPELKTATEEKFVDSLRVELTDGVVPRLELDGQSLKRASVIKTFAAGFLDGEVQFDGVMTGFRNLLEERAVRTILAFYWPPKREGDSIELFPPDTSEPTPTSANGQDDIQAFKETLYEEVVDAFRRLVLVNPGWLRILAVIQREDPALFSASVLIAHRIQTKAPGRREAPPEPYIATRVVTIEALRDLCDMSQASARRLWDHWFPRYAYRDASGKRFSDDHKRVRKHFVRLLMVESYRLHRMTDAELRTQAQSWRAGVYPR